MRSSSSTSRRPSLSRALYASSSAILPAITPLAIIAGWKRAPSSFVKMTSVTGWRVRTLWSLSERMASSPHRTPSWPSYLPPVGTESACEPIMTGGREAVPARSPKMLPIWSTVTRNPASRIQRTRRSRPRRSSSLRASRVRPPRSVAPTLPSSSIDRSSRLRSIFMEPPYTIEYRWLIRGRPSMLKAGRRSVRRKRWEAHVHPVWLALLLILSLGPSPSAHAQTLRAERPTLTVGEKWIRSDGAYELVRIEGGAYVFAAGSGREIHLNRDLHIVRTRRGTDIVEWD